VWLLELVVAVSHGRPYHPQTQGKDERFRRTVVAEVIGRRCVADLAERQHRFAQWRVVYNTRRPHQALDLATPAARYRPSPRAFPEKLEPLDYGPGALVRRVDASGRLSCRNRPIKLGHAFVHRRVALRPADHEGCFDVLFCGHIVAPSICARRHRERLPEARPGGSTGTSRAPLRQIRGRSVGARVPRVDFRDELRRANPSIISPNTCPPCVRALHRPGFVKSP
jgi:hypothetical protein